MKIKKLSKKKRSSKHFPQNKAGSITHGRSLLVLLSRTWNQNQNHKTHTSHLHSKAGHFNPQTIHKCLKSPLGNAVHSHVQAVKEGKDAGGVNHPTCQDTEDTFNLLLHQCGPMLAQSWSLCKPLVGRTRGRNAMEVLMEPNRLTSTMWRKSSMLLHSISAISEIPALFTTAHRPAKKFTGHVTLQKKQLNELLFSVRFKNTVSLDWF